MTVTIGRRELLAAVGGAAAAAWTLAARAAGGDADRRPRQRPGGPRRRPAVKSRIEIPQCSSLLHTEVCSLSGNWQGMQPWWCEVLLEG